MEPRQEEPTQTNRDCQGAIGAIRSLLGTIRAIRPYWGAQAPSGRVLGNVSHHSSAIRGDLRHFFPVQIAKTNSPKRSTMREEGLPEAPLRS